jgi:hypothetical protein
MTSELHNSPEYRFSLLRVPSFTLLDHFFPYSYQELFRIYDLIHDCQVFLKNGPCMELFRCVAVF